MAKEATSSRIAKLAARGMSKPESLKLNEIVAICASALTQFEVAATVTTKRKAKTNGR